MLCRAAEVTYKFLRILPANPSPIPGARALFPSATSGYFTQHLSLYLNSHRTCLHLLLAKRRPGRRHLSCTFVNHIYNGLKVPSAKRSPLRTRPPTLNSQLRQSSERQPPDNGILLSTSRQSPERQSWASLLDVNLTTVSG
jgi:hypothetical protein